MTDAPASDTENRTWARSRAALPYVVAAALFALGLYALFRLLAEVDLRDVTAQIRETHWSTLLMAFAATICGYIALVGYDWSALRYIGKPLPLPVVITGGFMAYAFGNTIGLSALSGGAVRYRIYSALGLDGYDVAAVSSFAAVSFGVAVTVIGLGAVLVHPMALANLSPLPPHLMQLVAVAGIAGILVPLAIAAVRQGELKIWRMTIKAPSLPVIGAQIIFSVCDITFSALALYVLLPASEMGFPTFLAVFAAASMAGVISHVPGGVGVFEAVVIAALPPSVPIEQAAAALLLFRLIYFLLPFAIALVMLAIYELYMGTRGPAALLRPGKWAGLLGTMAPVLAAVSAIAPVVLATMVFGSGLWMMVSALIPQGSDTAEAMELLLPLAFAEGSALLSSAVGAVLIILAFALSRRIEGAYWIAIGFLLAGAGIALAQGFDLRRAGALIGAALVLAPFRREFHRGARLTRGVFSPGWLALVAGVVVAGAFVFFFATKSTPYAHELWWQFALDKQAPRAMRAGLVGSLLIGLGLLAFMLRAPRFRPAPPDAASLAKAQGIIEAQGGSDACLALTGDKSLMFSEAGDGFIMFGVQGRSWITLRGPVGPKVAAERLVWAFADAARAAGGRPVFYQLGEEHLPLMLDLGLALHKLGEEAVVRLEHFSLTGPDAKKLRTTHARALRDGLAFDRLYPPHSDALMAELGAISGDWLTSRKAREKRFSVGQFGHDWVNRWPVAIVRHQGRIVAFATILSTPSRMEAAVDLMRHRASAGGNVMEFLFIELMLALKADGYQRFSLGMAPLAGLEARRGAKLWTRFGATIFQHGGHFYNFAGLRAFKAKFNPDWHPRYLAVTTANPPLVPLGDAAMLIAGGFKGVVARNVAPALQRGISTQ